MSIQWGLSVLDFHRHAIDTERRHRTGVLKAECGHLLMMVTPLDAEPYGRLCEACATRQVVVVQAALDRAAAALREAQIIEANHLAELTDTTPVTTLRGER